MSVNVGTLIKDLNLEVLVKGKQDNEITVSDFNRPVCSFLAFILFCQRRIQIIGMAEWALDAMQPEIRKKRLKSFCFDTPCIIITRNLEPQAEILEYASKNGRWLLRTPKTSTKFIGVLTIILLTN